MKPGLTRWLVRLYPPAWRARYGAEFEALLEHERLRPGLLIDLLRAATLTRLSYMFELKGHLMQTYPASVLSLIRKPSAFLPLLMSLAALILVIGFLLAKGVNPPQWPHDEELPAHIFHLLMVGQLPFTAFFCVRWLGKDWRAALSVLGLQVLAIILAVAIPVAYHW